MRQLLWHFNRLPTGRLLKGALRLLHAGNVRSRKRLAQELRGDGRWERLASEFNREGHVRLDGLLDPKPLGAILAAGEVKIRQAETAAPPALVEGRAKTFWSRPLDFDMREGKLPTDNPFVQFAMQPQMLRALAEILGEVPLLDNVVLTYSRHTNAPLSYSQLWHRDHDDTRTIKLFVYLTEVASAEDGPFTMLPRPVSDAFSRLVRHSHRDDAEIFKRVDPARKIQVIAPRGSVFLVETSRCMHMGSRVGPGHSRLLYTASYITVPRIYPSPPELFEACGELSPAQQKLLSA